MGVTVWHLVFNPLFKTKEDEYNSVVTGPAAYNQIQVLQCTYFISFTLDIHNPGTEVNFVS